MPTALVCMSHSPLLEFAEPPAEVLEAVRDAFDRARVFVTEFEPTLVVSFAPDHYNGFFYDLMPPFCVGYEAEAVGDYDTRAGRLDVPTEISEGLAQHLLDVDIDMAISRRMEVDHGAVQPLEVLFGDIAGRPVVPIFINSVAPPFVGMRRIRRMGAAVGDYVRGLEQRVLFIGSGGLSHDPPVPLWATAAPVQRAMLLDGRHPTAVARAARQQRVIDTAREFAAGRAAIRDLNPEWDRRFMEICASGDLAQADALTPAAMAEEAGNSAHEVRTWLAAFSALSSTGAYTVEHSFYRPIPEFIAGFGVMTARVA